MARKEDISNSTLATLLVVSIVISVGGTYVVLQKSPSITGMFTSTAPNGTVSFTQQGVLSLRLANGTSTFGNITSTAPFNCTVSTDSGGATTGWNCSKSPFDEPMVLENDGNVPAMVQVNSTKDKNQTFALSSGATDPYTRGLQFFKATNFETGACATQPGNFSTYAVLGNASDALVTVCSVLRHNNTEDALRIDYMLVISPDLTAGNQTENVTFWASQV